MYIFSVSEFKFTSCSDCQEASSASVSKMDSEPAAVLKSQSVNTFERKKHHSRMHGHTNSRRIYLKPYVGEPTKCEYFLNSHQMQMQRL